MEQVVFGFHDGRLFRVTVDYDREQTKGLMDADMVEAISAVYGPQVKPSVSRRRQAPSVYDNPGTSVAQWGNADNSVMLYRLSSSATSFKLVVTAEPIAALARTDAARALVPGCPRGAPARGGQPEEGSGRSPCGRGKDQIDQQSHLSAVMPNDLWLVVPSRVAR